MARLDWKGDAVRDRMYAAAALGGERTMARAVEHARDNHPGYPPASLPYERYANRTGFMTGSIRIFEPMHTDGPIVGGQWGSDARYALYLEIGTSRTGLRAETRREAGDGNLELVPPPELALMEPRPYIRPAMDVEYPLLAPRIGAAFRLEAMP